MKLSISCLLLLFWSLSLSSPAQDSASPAVPLHAFHVTSTAFENNTTMPLSTISDLVSNGVNTCTVDGSAGGDQSPELAWVNAGPRAVSFVVIAYDSTASFTHWGMYNIPASTTELPANAGVAGSTYGSQVFNDFFAGAEYDGPCPPRSIKPFVHHYVFTVYELDTVLHLPSSANFPASAETLYQALIAAARNHHILGSSRVVGLFSSTPPPPQ
jgi:Raf kinase inhibitor-like YbhB/YbcL family protein